MNNFIKNAENIKGILSSRKDFAEYNFDIRKIKKYMEEGEILVFDNEFDLIKWKYNLDVICLNTIIDIIRGFTQYKINEEDKTIGDVIISNIALDFGELIIHDGIYIVMETFIITDLV